MVPTDKEQNRLQTSVHFLVPNPIFCNEKKQKRKEENSLLENRNVSTETLNSESPLVKRRYPVNQFELNKKLPQTPAEVVLELLELIETRYSQ